jgi:hypothetical protein
VTALLHTNLVVQRRDLGEQPVLLPRGIRVSPAGYDASAALLVFFN